MVQKLLRKARKGARIIYLPGNHDEFLRDYYGTHFGGIEVVETAIHQAADGRRYLVVHGDVFDMVVKHARWLALLGDTAYDFAIVINTLFQRHPPPARVSLLVAVAMGQAQGQECRQLYRRLRADARGRRAQRHHVDGVICGHIHHAVMHDEFGIRYMNCGDWVESCTALAEHEDGRFEIITWIERDTLLPPLPDEDEPDCRSTRTRKSRPEGPIFDLIQSWVLSGVRRPVILTPCMELSATIERWPLANAFTISRGSKTEAVVVVVEIGDGTHRGRGEAVPYAPLWRKPGGRRRGDRVDASGAAARPRSPALQAALPAGAARNALDCASGISTPNVPAAACTNWPALCRQSRW